MARNRKSGFVLIVLTFAFSLDLLAAAIAQPGDTIDPRCTIKRRPRQCTCALETGGYIEPNGDFRYRNAPAYSACMKRRGWI